MKALIICSLHKVGHPKRKQMFAYEMNLSITERVPMNVVPRSTAIHHLNRPGLSLSDLVAQSAE